MIIRSRKKELGPLGGLILGMVVFAVGTAMFYFLGVDFTLTCDRSDNTCILQKENVLHKKEIIADFPLSDLKGAELEEIRSSKGKTSYQVMLATNKARIPFAENFNRSYSSCSKNVEKINAFISSTDENLTVTQSGTILRIFGLVFVAAGGYVLLHTLAGLLKKVLRMLTLLKNG